MKQQLFLFLTIFLSVSVTAQNSNKWHTHLSYNNAEQVEEANNKVFVVADGALYSYGKEDNEVILYSKQNGLSDTEIGIIKYSSDNNILVIVYSNGNIDLLTGAGISNMPDLKITTNVQSKGVHDIFFKDNYAYLSTDFGIMVVNLTKKEVKETYKLETTVRSACISGETLYAVTEKGLLQGNTTKNLLDQSNWNLMNIADMGNVNRICLFNSCITYCKKDDGIYYFNPSNNEIKTLIKHNRIKDISLESNKLLAHSDIEMYVFTTLNGADISIETGTINDVTSLKDDGKYWIAAGASGLVGIEQSGSRQFTTFLSDLEINSPKRNYDYYMTVNNGRLLITGGGRMLDRYRRPGTLMTYKDDDWFNLDEMAINLKTNELIQTEVLDYMCVAVDPDDENHYYIGTYGEGIIELKNNEFVNIFNYRNSSLQTAVPDYAKNYVRIGGFTFDKNKNLWILNGNVKNVLNVLKADGTWVSLYYPQLSDHSDKIDKILITSRGHKWINAPYGNAGIFVLDDKGTIDDTTDDTYNFFSTFRDAQSSTGGTIAASQYLSMAEDKTGAIWVGTNTGLMKCTAPSRAIDNPEQLSFSRMIRDGDAYFLNGESVTAIAVDNDNNKWIGTGNSGVFLINEDGSETIYDFTKENSPLLSNVIQSIAINNETGEVFIGTDKGLVSFDSGVKSGSSKFSDVYAFPNPVRPDFNDKVTITGLSNNTNVKITDINGNLIFQNKAVGNQLVWNCRNFSGNRVATGIYLVIAATSDASESVVTKIAVVK